jgi:hypothetical protein
VKHLQQFVVYPGFMAEFHCQGVFSKLVVQFFQIIEIGGSHLKGIGELDQQSTELGTVVKRRQRLLEIYDILRAGFPLVGEIFIQLYPEFKPRAHPRFINPPGYQFRGRDAVKGGVNLNEFKKV